LRSERWLLGLFSLSAMWTAAGTAMAAGMNVRDPFSPCVNMTAASTAAAVIADRTVSFLRSLDVNAIVSTEPFPESVHYAFPVRDA